MKRRLPLIILLVVAATAAIYVFKHRTGRDTSASNLLYGNVDIREVHLGFRVSGKLAEVLKDEGDPVAAGDVLARLDTEPFRREVTEARARVAAARARLQLLEAGSRPQEIAQARAVVAEREVSLANAESTFKRIEELFGTGAVAAQDRDDAQARYREAQARLSSAKEQLNVLEVGFRVEEIARARAELQQTEAAVAVAELKLDDSVLKAPAVGVVLTRAQEPGAILPVGANVFTLSLQKPVWVRAYVAEPNLGRIHPGMRVSVHTDSSAAKPYAGTIGYISPRAEFTPKNVETPELRTSLVYRLRIVIAEPDDGLRQGMPVTVKLTGS